MNNMRREISIDQISIGSHLVIHRKLYTHHGIYVGNGQVIHYAGLADGFKKDKVRIVDIKKFANGSKIYKYDWGNYLMGSKYPDAEIVVRAYSRLNESDYNVLWNNCEAFANWCTHGDNFSSQTSGTVEKNGRIGNLSQAGGLTLLDYMDFMRSIFKRK